MLRKGFFDEFKTKCFWKAVFLELLGTTLFIFLITSTSIIFIKSSSNVINIKEALTVGISAIVLIGTFGKHSGAHMNPALSCGAYVNGDISSPRASMYSLAQYTGGVLGAGLTWLLTPSANRGDLGVVFVKHEVTVAQAFTMETILTIILTLVFLTVQKPKREGVHGGHHMAAIFIGLAYLALHLVGVEYTSGSINPARAFGPSLVRNKWVDNSWIYWVAPYVGSTIAGLLHRFLLKTSSSPPQNTSISIDVLPK